jgi:hypothetical protein
MTNNILNFHDDAATCLDEKLSAELWRLEDPDCPSDLRQRLDHHVTYCAACRLQLAVERRIAGGLADGSLKLRRRRPAAGTWFTGAGAAALAAGLAMILLLPPLAALDGVTVRGDDQPGIERPVPDEVVFGRRPTLRWTPVSGATSYEVRVTAVDDNATWTTTTTGTEVTVPEGFELQENARYRLRVETTPAHVAPDGGLATSFSTGGAGSWLQYRLTHSAAGGRWVGGLGALSLLVGLGTLLWRRDR